MLEKKNDSATQILLAEWTRWIGGLAVVALAIYMISSIENGLANTGLSLLGIGIIGLTVSGLRTGKMELRDGHVFRHENPIAFWGFGAFYLIVGLFMLAFVVLDFFLPI